MQYCLMLSNRGQSMMSCKSKVKTMPTHTAWLVAKGGGSNPPTITCSGPAGLTSSDGDFFEWVCKTSSIRS